MRFLFSLATEKSSVSGVSQFQCHSTHPRWCHNSGTYGILFLTAIVDDQEHLPTQSCNKVREGLESTLSKFQYHVSSPPAAPFTGVDLIGEPPATCSIIFRPPQLKNRSLPCIDTADEPQSICERHGARNKWELLVIRYCNTCKSQILPKFYSLHQDLTKFLAVYETHQISCQCLVQCLS